MKFELVITLGNAAMQTPADVANTLREVAHSLEFQGMPGDATDWRGTARITDANGNTVGYWAVER